MQAKIGVGMGFGIRGYFGDSWAWHHDAGGGDSIFVERVEACRIDGVRYGEIVGVDDEQLRIGRVAEAFRDGFGLGGEIRDNK